MICSVNVFIWLMLVIIWMVFIMVLRLLVIGVCNVRRMNVFFLVWVFSVVIFLWLEIICLVSMRLVCSKVWVVCFMVMFVSLYIFLRCLDNFESCLW